VLFSNGSLAFKLAARAFGTATLTVVLSDDAGVAYGGGDRATLTVAVVIYDNPAAFSPAMTLAHTVAENDGRVILTGFLDLQLSAVTQVRPAPKLFSSSLSLSNLKLSDTQVCEP